MVLISMNRVKEILRKGGVALGVAVTIGHPEISEILSKIGFDWIVFDTEHSPLTIETVQTMIQAMRGETVPMIRVAWNDPVLIKRALDIGAYGVIIPWINSKREAVNAVKSCKYPPRGIRGVGPRRCADYGLRFREYISTADEEILVAIQLETKDAVENAEEILSVEGIDAFIIGPADLSTSLGFRGDWRRVEVEEAIYKLLEAGRRSGVPAGMFATSVENAKKWINEGFQFMCVASDLTFLIQGGIQTLREFNREPRI